MKALLVIAGICLAAAPAIAQEDMVIDQTKVYVTEPSACQALEKNGVDAWMDADFLSLTFTGGIQSIEFHCNFYDIKSRPHTPVLFVDAVCELPGQLYPDTLAIAPYSENTIQVVSTADTMLSMTMPQTEGAEPGQPDVPTGTTIYTRCDNLSEIPFD